MMRKIILDLAVTLDGFIEGPKGEIDWCIMDEDMDFGGFLSGIDAIFYGRKSYDEWGNFEPGPEAEMTDKSLWAGVHSKRKYVFSRNPKPDGKATFISADISGEVKAIKAEQGRDIWLYGGAGLIHTFIRENLIDVYRISVHPVALGGGKPLFENLRERLHLNLTAVNTFKSGVVQLIYST